MPLGREQERPTLEYNLALKPGRPPVLVGHWSEDLALVADGYASRVAGKDVFGVDTFERVAPRTRASKSAKSWSTCARDAGAAVLAPRNAPPPGARGVAAAAAALKAAEAEVAAAAAARAAAAAADAAGGGAPRVSVTRAAYTAAPAELYAAAAAATVAASCRERDKDGLLVPRVAFGVTADPSAYAASDYRVGAAMTVFSARAPEGVFAGKPPAPGESAGSELSLALLATRFARRLAEAGFPSPSAFVDGLAAVSRALAAGGAEGASADEALPADAFRAALYANGVRLLDTHAASVAMLCDAVPRAGVVRLDALRALLARAAGAPGTGGAAGGGA